MDICWRTKNNDHPNGKPRVYVSCCGADFKRFGEKIIKQLFDICDCAVYFYPAGGKITTDEDYRFNLERMDLLVIPVTAELLCKPNRTMDFDVPYATQHNIPILPLLQEEGLVELFNQRFGALQFLQETQDRTAIPYQEKLKTFLDSVLADDGLSDEIRHAFCARIFLSYRKKDRAYAQELMRLIHSDPQFRDVAIWYDEFLIPGDNFERNIQRELKLSDLFLLAVTPNVLEPANYVMRTEYPAANNLLPVVPAQLAETDLAQLRVCFPGISDPVDAYDNRARAEILETLLSSKLRRDPSAYHQYLMGMAYFRGVDVEKDPQKGINLLKEAAGDGVAAAAKKLADIYHLGDHVPRDYTEAKYWLTQLTNLTAKAFAACADAASAAAYYRALVTAGSVCEQNLDEAAAVAYYEQAIAVAQLLCEEYGYSRKLAADSCANIARVYMGADRYDKALPYRQEVLKLLEALQSTSPSAEMHRDLADCYVDLANCHREIGDLEPAAECFEKAAAALQQLLKLQKSPEMLRELVELYDDLADLQKTLGNKKKMRVCEKEAARLFKTCRKELETAGEATWMTAARFYMKRGQYRTALKWMEKALEASVLRAKEDASFANERKLAAQYSLMGILWDARNNRKNAEKFHRLGVAVLEKLIAQYPNPQLQLDLIESYDYLADALDRTLLYDDPEDILYSDYRLPQKDRPATEEAYGMYQKALELFEGLQPDMGLPEIKQKMELLDNLGRLSKALGLKGEAIRYYRQYGALSCDLYEQHETAVHMELYADGLFKLALLTLDADLMEEARDCYRKLAAVYPGNRSYAKKRNEAQRLLDA